MSPCWSKPVCMFMCSLLVGIAGCKTYQVDNIFIKSDATEYLKAQSGRTFSVEIGNNFVVVTQMHEGNVPTGPQTVDFQKTNKYKAAIEQAIVGEMTARGFIYSFDNPEIQIIYRLNFSGKYIGGYSKHWTIFIDAFDQTYKRVLFEVIGEFRSIPELHDELANELVAELMNGLALTKLDLND